MFEKNDKQLLTVRILLNIVTCIFVLAGIISGIILSTSGSVSIGLILMFLVPFFSWLMWVAARLYLTYLCDIKLIRNKLYGVDNDNLKVFLEEKTEIYKQPSQKNSSTDRTEELLRLKRLLDSGAITQEEFDREKEKLLK